MVYDRIGPVRFMHGALIDPNVSLLVNFKVFYLSRNCELLLCLQYFMKHNIVALHLQSCIRGHSTYNYVGTSTNFSATEYILCIPFNLIFLSKLLYLGKRHDLAINR